VAAVLVVSPPVRNCRGRNVATGGRYAGSDAAWSVQVLNAEVECISRVVVHPIYRGCGLAVRLVRHALEHAGTPLVEALAAMGAVHPLFELAGMKAYHVGRDRHAERFLSAADVVGLSRADVAAVKKITDVVNCKFQIADCPARVAEGIGGSGAGPDANSQSAIHNPQFSSPASVLAPSQVAFLKKELDLYIRRTLPRRIWGTSQAIANACRRATVVPVYYLGHRPGCHGNAAKAAEATSYACPSYQNHKNMRESCPIVPNRSQSFPIMPNRSHSCPIVPDGG
jgi:GNAT superfamily N-acetyltransferase